MNPMTYKATYTLDKHSIETIEYLSNYWGTSKAEVIRRCVRYQMDVLMHRFDPTSVLESLEKDPSLRIPTQEIENWMEDLRFSREDWDQNCTIHQAEKEVPVQIV